MFVHADILEHWGDHFDVKPVISIDRHYSQYDTPKEDGWMSMSDVDSAVIGNIYEKARAAEIGEKRAGT